MLLFATAITFTRALLPVSSSKAPSSPSLHGILFLCCCFIGKLLAIGVVNFILAVSYVGGAFGAFLEAREEGEGSSREVSKRGLACDAALLRKVRQVQCQVRSLVTLSYTEL